MLFSKIRPLLLAAALLPQPAIAQAQDSEAAYLRLDLASGMRTETQKMVRLACYIRAGFHIESQRALLQESIAHFEAAQQALIDGDTAMGLDGEVNTRILAAMSELSRSWPVLSAQLGAVVNGEALSPSGLAALDMESLALLEKADTLVKRIASVYGEALDSLPLIMSLSIDMAGRQVMRTEKAAKEACLIGSGVDATHNRQALETTVSVFSATMDALIEGFPGMIVPAPSQEIKSLLENARARWNTAKTALVTLYSTGEISDADRMTVGMGLEEIAAKLRDAALLYQDIQLDE
jgi:hypothetical protein